MANYTFGTLSPTEFETLTRDLISESRKVSISTFKVGKDTGIDFRYIDSEGRVHIGQAKHYANSPMSALRAKLQQEVVNVENHKPYEYIVATSLGLSPTDEDDIKQLFLNAGASTVTVLGRESLNSLIETVGQEIERRHFKLWLTSLNVLEKVLKSRILSQTDYTMEAVKRKLSRYVQNQSFPDALNILNDHHVCIISGDPGVGKTTLAQVLLAHYVDQGFTPIKVTSTIAEAVEMDHGDTRRVYYYDDFLGRVSLNPLLEKNEDQAILEFMDKVSRTPNQRLILTTREYILRDAVSRYERISDAQLARHKYVLTVGKYTIQDRCAILFNHLYFSELPQEYIVALVHSGHLVSLIRHPHYNPRIVEALTMSSMLAGIQPSEYGQVFLASLDDPKVVYQHIFENQLSEDDRSLLYVLYSLDPECELDYLELAFSKYIRESPDAVVDVHSRRVFEQSLRRLDDTLTSMRKVGGKEYITFHNPSVEEFIGRRIQDNLLIAETLCRSAMNSSQAWSLLKCLGSSAVRNTAASFRRSLYECIERTLGTEVGRLYPVVDSLGNPTSMFRAPVNKTDQIIRVAESLKDFKEESAVSLVQRRLSELRNMIELEACTCSECFNACRRLEQGKFLSESEFATLLEDAKRLLANNCEYYSDWDSIRSFVEFWRVEFSEDQQAMLHEAFSKYCDDAIESDYDDEDDWRNEARLIGWFGESFDWDLDGYVDKCAEKAEEARGKQEPDFDDYDPDRDRGRGSSHTSDAEIIAVFDPLIEGFRGEY